MKWKLRGTCLLILISGISTLLSAITADELINNIKQPGRVSFSSVVPGTSLECNFSTRWYCKDTRLLKYRTNAFTKFDPWFTDATREERNTKDEKLANEFVAQSSLLKKGKNRTDDELKRLAIRLNFILFNALRHGYWKSATAALTKLWEFESKLQKADSPYTTPETTIKEALNSFANYPLPGASKPTKEEIKNIFELKLAPQINQKNAQNLVNQFKAELDTLNQKEMEKYRNIMRNLAGALKQIA
ncbi:MAG: hypothetical protein JW725_01880 [Candidatus Babeliaceae bacterium]|nr:hypothetical protein [Candidatus Babeliaceae bacterium]